MSSFPVEITSYGESVYIDTDEGKPRSPADTIADDQMDGRNKTDHPSDATNKSVYMK